jgi:hypothetical protein
VQKYHDFLEEVRSNNPDQYGSIMAIIDRHKTLQKLQLKLKPSSSGKKTTSTPNATTSSSLKTTSQP